MGALAGLWTMVAPVWWVTTVCVVAVVVAGVLVASRPRRLWRGDADAGAAVIVSRRYPAGSVAVAGAVAWPDAQCAREAAIALAADLVRIAMANRTVLVARIDDPELVDTYAVFGFREPTVAERSRLRIGHPLAVVFVPADHLDELSLVLRDRDIEGHETVTFPVVADVGAFIRGGYAPAHTSVDVDLGTIGQDERDLLADYVLTHGTRPVTVTAPTAKALVTALRAREDELRASRERSDRELAERVEAARAVVTARRTTTRIQTVYVDKRSTEVEILIADCPDLDRSEGWFVEHEDIVELAGAGAWLDELDETNKRRLDGAQQELWRQHTLESDRREAGRNTLREWANAHGSSELRARMRDKPGAWISACEKEWYSAHAPTGFDFAPSRYTDVGDAEAAFAADEQHLREAEELCDGTILSDARLRVLRTARGQTLLDHLAARITITSPTGKRRMLFRRLPRPATPDPTPEPSSTDGEG